MNLKELIEYDREMNLAMLDHLMAHDVLSDPYILKLASHVLNAQHIWLWRIHKTEPEYAVWQIHDMMASRPEFEAHYEKLFELCNEEDREVVYQNSKGISFSNSLRHILFHLVNHSNYHRAQINTKLVSLGRPALASDFIFYKREPQL